MQSNFSALFLAMLVAGAVSGCAAPGQPSISETTAPPSVVSVPWQIQAQRSLGCYFGASLPLNEFCPTHAGYCDTLSVGVPKGTNRLNLNFTYASLNFTDGSGGMMGFGARAPSGNPWVDYPTQSADVSSVLDQQRMVDNPKRLSFEKPEVGRWEVYSFTNGVENRQLGNLTIDLHGVSAQPPSSLGIEFEC